LLRRLFVGLLVRELENGARDIVDTVVSEANMNPYAIGAIDISDGNITVDVRAAVQDRVIQF